jgi:hypothetical protein
MKARRVYFVPIESLRRKNGEPKNDMYAVVHPTKGMAFYVPQYIGASLKDICYCGYEILSDADKIKYKISTFSEKEGAKRWIEFCPDGLVDCEVELVKGPIYIENAQSYRLQHSRSLRKSASRTSHF